MKDQGTASEREISMTAVMRCGGNNRRWDGKPLPRTFLRIHIGPQYLHYQLTGRAGKQARIASRCLYHHSGFPLSGVV